MHTASGQSDCFEFLFLFSSAILLSKAKSSSGKSDNFRFDVLLLSIAYKDSAKKVQKNYLWWPWRVIQPLKKDLLLVWKMRWEIWRILTRAVESLKICTFMGYFCRKYVMFELKKHRGVLSRKMTYGFTNDIRNLMNFHASSWRKSCQINPLYIMF